MKPIQRMLLVLAVAGFLLVLGRGIVVKAAVRAGVRAVTGLPVQIDRLRIGTFHTLVEAQGVRLLNPAGFPERMMADLPELYVDYDLPALFQGKVHLKELRIHLRELVVVRDRNGRLNLDSLSSVQQAKARKQRAERPQARRPSPLQIDRLHLKVGKVVYRDYSRGGEPFVQEFSVNLDERYANVTDPSALGSLIVARALFRTTVAQLANFDLGALNRQIQGILQLSVESAVGAVEETAERLKKLLPFSK